MKARIESLERTLLRAAEIAARRGRVGTRECGSMARFLFNYPPPPHHCNLIDLRSSRAPLYAFSYETAANLFFCSPCATVILAPHTIQFLKRKEEENRRGIL